MIVSSSSRYTFPCPPLPSTSHPATEIFLNAFFTSKSSVNPVVSKISYNSLETCRICIGLPVLLRSFINTLSPALEMYSSSFASIAIFSAPEPILSTASKISFSICAALFVSILPSRKMVKVPFSVVVFMLFLPSVFIVFYPAKTGSYSDYSPWSRDTPFLNAL